MAFWRFSLTEVGCISVEYGQTNKLLYNLRPGCDEESNKVAALEQGPSAELFVLFCDHTFVSYCRAHHVLSIVG